MADRNEVPVEQWLEVWGDLKRAATWHESGDSDEAIGWVIDAMAELYVLLEPPSVREARLGKDDAVAAMVEEDE